MSPLLCLRLVCTQVTRHLLEIEAEQITFHPVIEKRSAKLARRKGRNGELPIEDILRRDGNTLKQKMERGKPSQSIDTGRIKSFLVVREQIESDKLKDCSFHPSLYTRPRHVKPVYRGQEKEESTYLPYSQICGNQRYL